MSDYYTIFKREAETAIKPLAEVIRALMKQLAELRQRLIDEQENLAQHEREADKLKSLAGASLGGDINSFERFKTSLRKKTGLIATSREVVDTLGREVLPNVERELAEARCKRQAALLDFLVGCRPACESRMAELIGTVLAERDDFMAAFSSIFADFGGDFTGNNRVYPDGKHYRPSPARPDFLIQTTLDESTIDRRSLLSLAELMAERPAPPPEAPVPQKSAEAPIEAPTPGAPQGQGVPKNEATAHVESSIDQKPAQDTTLTEIVDPISLFVSRDESQDGQEAQDVPQDILFEAEADDAGPAAVPVDSPEGQAQEPRSAIEPTGDKPAPEAPNGPNDPETGNPMHHVGPGTTINSADDPQADRKTLLTGRT